MYASGIWLRRIGLLLVAGVALSGSGCLAVAAGAVAAGAAGAGFAYTQAAVPGEFNADLPNMKAAAELALKDLGLPMLGAKEEPGEIFVSSRTLDGTDIDITLTAAPDRQKTRVAIRVGTFGDRSLSERVLEQMGKNLQVAGIPGQPLNPIPVTTNQTGPPPLANAAPGQTAPPPLAVNSQTEPPPLAKSEPGWQRTPPIGN